MGVNNTPFSQLPIPDKDAARDLPYWFSQLGNALDSKLTVYATSASNRDSLFATAPRGTLCISTTDGTVWVKTSLATALPATWGTVYSPTLPLTPINITLESGFQSINSKTAMVLYNPASREWNVWGNVARTDNSSISAFTTIGYLPAAVKLPTYQAWWDGAVGIQTGSAFDFSSGKVGIFVDNNRITYYGHDCSWVSLDGIKLPSTYEYV